MTKKLDTQAFRVLLGSYLDPDKSDDDIDNFRVVVEANDYDVEDLSHLASRVGHTFSYGIAASITGDKPEDIPAILAAAFISGFVAALQAELINEEVK